MLERTAKYPSGHRPAIARWQKQILATRAFVFAHGPDTTSTTCPYRTTLSVLAGTSNTTGPFGRSATAVVYGVVWFGVIKAPLVANGMTVVPMALSAIPGTCNIPTRKR